MKEWKIIIESGDPSTDKLKLSNDDFIAERRDLIIWSIKDIDKNNVKSFKIRKISGGNIFIPAPPIKYDTYLERNISVAAPKAVYKYAIHWKDSKGLEHVYDPKISVASKRHDNPVKIIFIILSVVFGLFTLEFLRSKIKNR